ncbi:hypothetical protein OYT13_13910 [Pandoraea sp. XJJ-1]|uniref:hypothetical protein n=1 Tax=Pandoraea sp. XJJ-1 TaxID=3002643 RepID=UPI0022810EF8|nr:hypothetical protein [Pandoraea sp. XJJ-1]WAL80969.1 hypothetical protein OYT13_13910 [Pandoraea sp. XJJ-1]
MGRQATIWTQERKDELKRHWEAGMPHSELSRLYPGYSPRSLANQALQVGAHRPEKQDTARTRILRHLQEQPNQTVVDVTRVMPFSADHVRGVMRALHADGEIRIVDYGRGASHVYAYGGGPDMTLEEWRAGKAATKASAKRKPKRKRAVSFNEARVIYSVATAGAFPVHRDHTVAALFGSP